MPRPAKPKVVAPDAPAVHRLPATRRARLVELAQHFAPRRGGKAIAFQLPKPFPGVLPSGGGLAMDFDEDLLANMRFAGQYAAGEGLGFLGYTVLAELAQRPEFRRFSEVIAEEMTRKFIRVTSSSDESQQMRIKLINDALDKFDLKSVFRKLAEVDGLYGRANLYPEFNFPLSDEEKRSPLLISKETVPLHSLKGFKVVEPFWTYPTGYDTRDPTDPQFYKPRGWYVMGREYHASRMMSFVGREVPDILKPVYAFGGLSLTQMVKPYVDNWIRTRQNVADAVENFAQNVLKTNLETTLTGGAADDLDARIALYNAIRSSRGLMVLDQGTEDFATVALPLSGLAELQGKAQEMLCSIAAIPLVKYLGIQPSGLNADSDGVIRTFYDGLGGQQPKLFGPHMKFVLDLIMQSELGEVNPDISYSFEPLWQMSEVERAQYHKSNADTAKVYIDAGVLDPAEERERLATEEDGLYQGLDPDDLPEPPPQPGIDPQTGLPLPPGGVDPTDPEDDDGEGPGGGLPPFGGAPDPSVAQDLALDADWQEHLHPRGEGGKFTSGPAQSPALKTALHPDQFSSAVTKKLLEKLHGQVDLAHALDDPAHKQAALEAIKAKTHEKYAKVHSYLDALLKEHGQAAPKKKPSQSEAQLKLAAALDYVNSIEQGMNHGEALASLHPEQLAAVKGLSAHELHKLAGTPGSEKPPAALPQAPPAPPVSSAWLGGNPALAAAKTKAAEAQAPEPAKSAAAPLAAFKQALNPDDYTSAVTKQLIQKVHGKVQSALKQPNAVAALKNVKDNTNPKYTKVHQALNALITAQGGAAAVPAPAASKPSGPVTPSQKTKDLKAGIEANYDKVSPNLKGLMKAKLDEINTALAAPDSQAALAKLDTIDMPHGLGQKSVNDYLTSLKADHGIAPPPPKAVPSVALTPKQQAHYEAVKAAPPIVHDRVHHATTHDGQPLKAVLKASSADVPGDWYAKVTAKLEGDHEHGPHVVTELDPIIDAYTAEVSYNPLSDDHKDTLKGYQDSTCYAINDAMNSSPPKDPPPPGSALGKRIKQIKEAINKSVIPTNLPVWRGIGASFESITGFADPQQAVGKGFVHKSFASVSRNKQTSVNFAKDQTLLKFTVPAGTRGQFMPGQNGGEREIVLDSHSIFRIDKVEDGQSHGVKHLVHVTYLGRREGT